MIAVFQPTAKIQKVYNIYVEAQGDPKQAEALLSKMDSAALKAMVGK